MLVSVLTAAGLGAVAWPTRWRRFALLGSLAFSAQAGILALTDAPAYTAYQHLRLSPPLTGFRALAVALLVTQAVVVVAQWRRWWGPVAGTLRLQDRGIRRFLPVLIVVFGAAVPASSVRATMVEFFVAAAAMALMLANLVLAALAMPADAAAAARDWLGRHVTVPGAVAAPAARLDRWFGVLCAFAVALAGAVICLVVFDGVPHIDDSVSYLFQAKTYATGRLYLPAPPDSAAFHVGQVVMDQGRWFAYGFPGWPSLLALGVVAGVPWLVNPLVSGICVLLAHHLLRRTHDRGIANATAALFAVSPWFLFMAGEFLSHQAATMWLLLALLGVQLARERSSARWGLVAGLALGALCLTRPLDGVIAGLVIAAWTLGLAGARRLALRPLLAGLLGVGAMGVAGLAYNRAITGDPLRTAHGMWMDRAWGAGTDRLGFGADRGNDAWPQVDPLPGHGLPDVVINANRNIFQLNVDLLGWGFGSLLIALVFLMSSGVQPRDRFLVLLVLATPLAYSTYWFGGGPDHGARYWYLTLVPLLVFTARGAQVMAARATPTSGGPVAPAMLAFAAVVSLLAFMPWRATGKYPGYRGVTAEPARLALRHQVRDAVVFIRSPERAHYQSAFNLNPRQLSDPGTVYARYLDEASRGRVMAAFPGRASWVFSNDDTPGGGWSVAGPYPPGSVPP